MKRDNIFWGTALILVGVLFFLQTQGSLTTSLDIRPLALILVGGWIILNVYCVLLPLRWRHSPFRGAAKSVRFKFSHAPVNLRSAAARQWTGARRFGCDRDEQGEPLDGDSSRSGGAGPSFVPFVGPAEGVWRFNDTGDPLN